MSKGGYQLLNNLIGEKNDSPVTLAEQHVLNLQEAIEDVNHDKKTKKISKDKQRNGFNRRNERKFRFLVSKKFSSD